MNIRTYNVGDLRKVIKESANEFKPKLGVNVEADDKKINDKAYKDMDKEVKAYNGGIKVETNKPTKFSPSSTDNKGMQDLEYLNMNPEFQKRVKAQMKGYSTVESEKNNKNAEFGNADYGTDADYDELSKKAKHLKKSKDMGKEIGLTGSKIPKKDFEELNSTMFENKKLQKLNFKHTEFISENHMLTKIPDDYKTEGNIFIMKDKSENEFLVEWKENEKPLVTKQFNKLKLQEEKNRIKALYDYKSKEYFVNTDAQMRLKENKEFNNVLGKVRSLMK